MSLNEFFAAALAAYLEAHRDDEITEALDTVYESESSFIDPALVQIQAKSTGDESW